MDIKNIRTGVIGVGSMGKNHARIYNEISNLIGVADPDENQGRALADKFGIKWFSDYKQMLSSVDAVSIAVPTFMHMEVAKKVAEAGVHMLVEKPLSGNSEDAERIMNFCSEAELVLAVGHVERFNPVVTKITEMIKNESLGRIFTLTSRRFSSFPDRIRDVGVLFDLTIHDVDIICSLAQSEVVSVSVSGGKARNKSFEDHVIMTLNFENGMIGLCETNWLTPMKVRELNLTTTDCYVNLNYLNQKIEISSSKFGNIDESNLYKTGLEFNKQQIMPSKKEPLKEELINFLLSINNKSRPMVDAIAGLRAVRIVEAGLESLTKNKIIKLK